MTPEELKLNYIQAFVYYCSTKDNNRYLNSTVNVLSPQLGTVLYDDVLDIFYVSGFVPTTYNPPTQAELLALNLNTVLTFWQNAYANPSKIIKYQPFATFSSDELKSMEISQVKQDTIVNNTSVNRNFELKGSTWVATNTYFQSVRILRNGSIPTLTFNPSQVRAISFSGGVNVETSSIFNVDATTSKITFIGPSQKLKIYIKCSVLPASVLVTGEVSIFANINNNTSSIPATFERACVSWPSLSALVAATKLSVYVSDEIQCNTNDTIQIGVQLSAGILQSIALSDLSIKVVATM